MRFNSSHPHSADNLRWMMLALLVAVIGANAGLLGKAPAPVPAQEKAKKMDPKTFTIDFANLPGNGVKGDYHLEVKALAIDGTNTPQTYNVGGGTSREAIRDLVMGDLADAGWRVKPVGTEAFVVEGYAKKTFSPIKTVVVKCPDLPQNQQPTVKPTPVVEPKKESSDK